MTELPLWAKRTGPWIVVVVLFLTAAYMFMITPGSMIASPLYWFGFAGWGVLTRLLVPIKQAIPKRRKGRGPVIGWGAFAAIGLSLFVLSRMFDVLLPLFAAFAGFPTVMASLLAYDLLWRSKLLYCGECGTQKYFLRSKNDWFCSVCGSRPSASHFEASVTH